MTYFTFLHRSNGIEQCYLCSPRYDLCKLKQHTDTSTGKKMDKPILAMGETLQVYRKFAIIKKSANKDNLKSHKFSSRTLLQFMHFDNKNLQLALFDQSINGLLYYRFLVSIVIMKLAIKNAKYIFYLQNCHTSSSEI